MRTKDLTVNTRNKLFFVLLLTFIPFCSFAQKAYEAEYYRCSFQGKVLKLTLANGYIGASEISLFNLKNKPVLFRPDNGTPDQDKQMVFNADNSKRKDYFILSNMEEVYENPPSVIRGQYRSGTQTVAIKFIYIK